MSLKLLLNGKTQRDETTNLNRRELIKSNEINCKLEHVQKCAFCGRTT